MTFISYAQNFEDVMLWRALKDVNCGFYIDVGANDPCNCSVTKAFYDRGWRGINIEPVLECFKNLSKSRCLDINLQLAAGAEPGVIAFYEIETGLSTFDKVIADNHASERGYKIIVRAVNVKTITEICEEHRVACIHFLKVDVEGAEKQVLEGIDFSKIRPWIILIEATRPLSQIQTYKDWEFILLSHDYEFVYFDGLNRFYVANEHPEIKEKFYAPPNVFDNFLRYNEARLKYIERIMYLLAHPIKLLQRILHRGMLLLTVAPLRQLREVLNKFFFKTKTYVSYLLKLKSIASRVLFGYRRFKVWLQQKGKRIAVKVLRPQLLQLTPRAQVIYAALTSEHFSIQRKPSSELIVKQNRLKLAYISPLPPERSGISDYSIELLSELVKYYEIDVISQQSVADEWVNQHLSVRSIEWFKQNCRQFPRVLYHFGNSPLHQHMFELLSQIPGVVVLHDFFLSGVVAHLETIGLSPAYWTQTLFHAHGYKAVQERFQTRNLENCVLKYPCNLSVLQQATGMIVHSQNSVRLAKQWYGDAFADDWSVIPLLRLQSEKVEKGVVRKKLGIPDNAFLICSFGSLNHTKLNHMLLESFLSSTLAENPDVYLVFVGENHRGEYGERITKNIRKTKLNDRVKISGWVDTSIYRQYLEAADIGVQLRCLSRGETSAAALDCMNYGLATIINANGAMADLPRDAVWMLEDNFDCTELVRALETLWKNPQQRLALGKRAQEIIKTKHDPAICARLYSESIERAYCNQHHSLSARIKALAQENLHFSNVELIELANCLAKSFPAKPRIKQLLVDVSSDIHSELNSDRERVAQAQLLELLNSPPKYFLVEPVYLVNEGGWHYRYARKYVCNLLEIKPFLSDERIDAYSNDVLYIPDFCPNSIEEHSSGILKEMKADGISIYIGADIRSFLQQSTAKNGIAKPRLTKEEVIT